MFFDVPVIEMLIVDCILHRYRGRVKNRMIIFICKDLTASERLTLSIILSLQFSNKEKIKNDPIPGTPKRHGETSFQGNFEFLRKFWVVPASLIMQHSQGSKLADPNLPTGRSGHDNSSANDLVKPSSAEESRKRKRSDGDQD